MDFDNSRSIYEQIREFVVTGILTHRWREDERLPSVRELAVELGVNPNTVQRSYSVLQEENLIQNQRGVGYFVAPDGVVRARRLQRQHFESETLPRVFATMQALEFTPAEFQGAWERWQGEQR